MLDTGMKQRLATILTTDATSHSSLMAANERATVAALDGARSVFKSKNESNQGQIIDMADDSVAVTTEPAIKRAESL